MTQESQDEPNDEEEENRGEPPPWPPGPEGRGDGAGEWQSGRDVGHTGETQLENLEPLFENGLGEDGELDPWVER